MDDLKSPSNARVAVKGLRLSLRSSPSSRSRGSTVPLGSSWGMSSCSWLSGSSPGGDL